MDFSNLRGINQSKIEQADKQVDKASQELAVLRTQEVFVKSIQALANIIQNHTTQTVVLNQLKDYAKTKDITQVESGIKDLLEQLKTHKNTDTSPIVTVLKDAVKELKSIPKDKVEIPEQKDYTKQFLDLISETKKVLTAIQEQETTVEAPVVNVEAPQVTVEAPDLKPLTKEINESFAKAIKSIVFPEYKVDLTEVEKKLDLSNKLLKDIRDTPGGGGAEGSGSIAPFLVNGALPVVSSGSTTYITVAREDSGDPQITYIGKAVPGTATSDAAWQIASLDENTNLDLLYADGGAFTQVYDDRESLTYE